MRSLGKWCGLAALLMAGGCASLRWERLTPMPDREGFAGSFVGASGGALLVAGGSNFPGKRPWEGGKKVWYDAVYALESPRGAWKVVGHLDRPTGYGVGVTTEEGLVCIGGGDGGEHFREVRLLAWEGGKLSEAALPDLPGRCAFMSGALVGETIYVVGGVERPAATECLRVFWALDMRHVGRGWKVLAPCPGAGRMLAVAGSAWGDFFVFSGARLSAGSDGKAVREYLKDGWRYRNGEGWVRVADMPRAAVAAPTPALWVGGSELWVVSGDDGTRVGFRPEEKHPGFPRSVLRYDVKEDAWRELGEGPISRATTGTALWNRMYVVPGGEARPGYRTAEVWGASERGGR